jgi:hypothetical protein
MKRLTSSTTFRIFILSVFCLSSIAVLLGANLYLASSAESRKDAITLRATGHGNSRIKFQSGRNLKAQYTATDVASAGIEKAFSKGKQGQAQALSLASDDINLDGFPDLVCGYAGSGGGLVTLHLGNPEAFSATRQETIQGIIKGRYPDPFLADASVLSVPEAPDFLTTGDFNHDGRLDILTAARGGSALYLLAGDENHGFHPAKALALPGNVAAMAAAQKSEQDGGMSLAVGINGPDGPTLLVYGAQRSLLEQQPSAYILPATVTAITPGRLDEDRSTDLAIIADGQLYVLHGQAKKATPDGILPDRQAGQLEPVALPFAVKAVAVSDFIWDRDARMELAVAADGGAVHIVSRGELDTRPFSASEVQARRQLVAQVRRGQKRLADLRTSKSGQEMNWAVAETTSLTLPNAGDAAQPLLMSTLASGQQSNDLLVMNPAARQLQIAFKENQKEASAARRESITFDVQSEPVAALPMRLNVMGRPGLVVMRKGHVEPSIVMATLASTFTVNNAGDTDDAAPGDGACADSGGNCTIRAAVQEANALAGADMITFAASTNGVPIQLTQAGDDNNAGNGDLDLNDDVTILGNGAANTIIQGSSDASFTGNMGDKIFGINQDGIFSTLNVSISGLTVRFTKNANTVGGFTETGGAMDIFLTGAGASPGPTVTVTNCTFDSNAAQNGSGGAINIDSGDLLGGTNIFRGTVQFTGCTISNNKTLDAGAALSGGGINLFADKHNVTFTNCAITGNQTSANGGSNGGGINIRHNFGGTITLNTTAVDNNTAGADGGGILTSSVGTQTLNIAGGSISGNTSQGTGAEADGGGLFNATNIGGSTSLSGVTISNNIATAGTNARGGGIEDGANSPLTIDNCTISGNSSDNGGGVAMTNAGGAQTTTITNSTISGNTATTGGALFVSSGILNASLNRIVSNTSATGSGIAQTGGTATVENNWWGCDGFPNAVGCQSGTGTFDADPRIDLRLTASPGTILVGGTSTLIADVSQNSNGAAINPTVLNGLTITFAGTLGTVSPTTAPLASLMASSTFTAASCGTATVSATLDNGTQTATIIINQAPIISACPANITTNADPSQCSAVVTYTAPTATGCPSPTVTCTPPSGSTFPTGTTTVNCTATNGITPDATCSFTVTVNDAQAPTITCPANITTNNDPNQCGAAVNYTTPTATDNCPGVGAVTCSPAAGSFFPKGTTTVNCTVSDAASNTASCSFTVTVNDTQAPTASCPSNITKSTDPNQCSAVVTYNATANDNCPGATVVCSPASGSTFPKGVTTVNCTATDTSSNTASCSFTVTVNDTQAPTIVCPPNQSVTAFGPTPVSYPPPTTSDNCPGTTVVCSPASGSTFPVGTTTVNCTATDTSGNMASCSFTVTVALACTITCPSNIVVNNAPGQCGAAVSFAPTATPGCGTVTCSPASGSFFPVGTTSVTCSTTAGPSCSFTVTVNDTEAPVITVNPMAIELWPPNHQYETIQVSSLVTSVTDNCGGTIPISNVVIARVSSDEPENGSGDGNTVNDIVIAANCKSVQLRAERQGGGNGRVYTITLQVKDSSNNVRTVTKTVGVPPNQSGMSALLGPGPGYSVTSNCVLAPL